MINEPEASDHRPVYAEIKFIPQNPLVKITTNYGDIVVELYPDKAPETVQNFLNYVDSFINVADNKSLNFRDQSIPGYGYCVFGKVVDGMDTVNKIKSVPTGNYRFHRDVPRKQVVIKSITRL